MTHTIGRAAVAVLAAAVAAAALTGCTGTSRDAAPATPAGRAAAGAAPHPAGAAVPALTAPPKVARSEDLGVPVSGGYGRPPRVTVAAGAAPTAPRLQVLHAGTGSPVALGRLLVADYQITSWGGSGAKARVLDDTFARHTPVAVVVGARQTLGDWDAILVGQKAGSRVLLLLPGSGGGSPAASAKAVVVDILGLLPVDGTAAGAAVGRKPGLPEVVSGPDRRPRVASVDGVTGTAAASQLVLAGTGPAISRGRTLVLQVLQADAATGRTLSQTWGGTPMLQRAEQLQALVPALAQARVGSRAVAVLPAAGGSGHAQVLVLDVLGQV